MVVGNRRLLKEWKVVKNQVHGYLALVKIVKLPTSKTLWLSKLEDVGLQLFPPSPIIFELQPAYWSRLKASTFTRKA